MDCILVSDDENDTVHDLELIDAAEQLEHIPSSTSTQKDELVAVELEIAEIDEEINLLRVKRSQLIERQKHLQKTLDDHRVLTFQGNSIEQWQRTDFAWSPRVTEVLQNIFQIKSFRPWQLETINVSLSNLDCILIMPTGGGKSLCYQLPALISDGITIVVSPLISLVEDQIYALKKLQVDARSLNTSTPRDEQTEIMRILDGKKTNGFNFEDSLSYSRKDCQE